MGTLRAIAILLTLGVATPVGMLLQALFLAIGSPAAKSLPVRYHRFVCRLLGVRVICHGRLSEKRPLLVVANHCSWLDIPVLSTIGPVSFVAKHEVSRWPVVGWLAKLQRTIFVDRERRSRTAHVKREIAERLAAGDVMVLFAEGTSSDGNQVLPFRSALIGAVHESSDGDRPPALLVQPVAVIYVRLNGIPMGRQHRPMVAWHGDLDMGPHVWRLLTAGTVDVEIAFGEPIALNTARERKAVAASAEAEVREMALTLLNGRVPAAGEHRAVPLFAEEQTR